MRIIIPPYMGNAISHTKNSSLASVITVPELMLTAQMIYSSTYRLKTPDASRARGHDPDRFCVAADGRRDGEIVDAERACHLFRRDAIGHQGGDAAAGRAVNVEGAELDEAVEYSVAGAGDVYAVGHALAYRVRGVTAADREESAPED